MFTGIVKACRETTSVAQKHGLTTLTVDLRDMMHGLQRGGSVSIDGVCLTVIGIDGNCVSFDAMEETLRRTTIGRLRPGHRVNVERSAAASDEIGGHRVSGHVHGVAEIIAVARSENNHVVTFRCPKEWTKYLFPKGFVALDGASLTIGDVDRRQSTFTVHFIPETLRMTTFGFKGEGDYVNLEVDTQTQAIVDTVERVLADRSSLLGRYPCVRGTVVRGQGIGHGLGFPTANLATEALDILPPNGIYAVWVEHDGQLWEGACSVGVRPTFQKSGERSAPSFEVYLIRPYGSTSAPADLDLYGQQLTVWLVAFLRHEAKFETVEALIEQIGSDVELTIKTLQTHPVPAELLT